MEKLTIVKIGGDIIDHKEKRDEIIKSFSQYPGKKILVHGGGKLATSLGEKMGIKAKLVDGRRITDKPMLDIVTMVYGGSINGELTAELVSNGLDAIGLKGADGNIFNAHKRPIKEIDYGWVGDIDKVDGAKLSHLLEAGFTPVIAPLTHDGAGHLLNTNGDTMASMIAIAMSPFFEISLFYVFKMPGVLLDAEDSSSIISRLDEENFLKLKGKGAIHGGMIPKLSTGFTAKNSGVSQVKICGDLPLLDLIENPETGTTLL